jgi:tripartite-type tricarboxylate transporter receptor subunit TctC
MKYVILALWLLVSTVAISAEQIRIVVPFPPGGPNDYFARLISQELSGVVENITGAGGMIAAERVANTKRIENTVILHSDAIMIALYLSEQKSYDLRSFSCLAQIGETYFGLFKHPNAIFPRPKSILSVADGGVGTTANLAAILAKKYINLNVISYRGAGPALIGFLAKDTDLLLEYVSSSVKENMVSGKIELIAITSAQRSPKYNVPTMKELGYTDVIVEPTLFLYSNASMSNQQKSMLNIEVNRIMRTERISSQIEAQNFTHKPYNLTECNNRVLQLETKWKEITKGIIK